MQKSIIFSLIGIGSLVTACSSVYEQDHRHSYYTESYTVAKGYESPLTNVREVKTVTVVDFAFPVKRKATGENVFIFDPQHKAWAAYDVNGYLLRQGPASGGKHFCEDIKRPCRTPAGTYKIYREGNAQCVSSKYPLGKGGAPMPYCMFFKGGYAVHGSHHVPNYNASHGCIRVTPADAAWLSQHHIDVGTTVIVKPY